MRVSLSAECERASRLSDECDAMQKRCAAVESELSGVSGELRASESRVTELAAEVAAAREAIESELAGLGGVLDGARGE